tara:strand:- start:2310 stop:2594 length:285 start_codon:yes stop_codon:yes gene_type:complete
LPNPSKGKRFVKVVKNPASGRTRRVSYGQAGAAKSGGDRIKPGTKKGDAYCARSAGIKRDMISKGGKSATKARDKNSPNNLSRKKWRCKGSKSS